MRLGERPTLSYGLVVGLLAAMVSVTTATAAMLDPIIPVRSNTFNDADPRFGARDDSAAQLPDTEENRDRIRAGWIGSPLRASQNVPHGAAVGLMEFELPLLPANHVVTDVKLTMTYANEGQNRNNGDHFEEVGGVNMDNWPPAGATTVDDLTWNVAIGPAADTPGVLIQGGYDVLLGGGALNFGGYNQPDKTASRINWNPNIVTPFAELWGPLPFSLREPLVQNYSGNGLLGYIQDNISETTSETVILTLGPGFEGPDSGENLTQWYSHLNEEVTCCMIVDDLAVPFDEPQPAAPPLLMITTELIPEPTLVLMAVGCVLLVAPRRRGVC